MTPANPTYNPSLNSLATPEERDYLRSERFYDHELCEPVVAFKRLPGLILAMIVDHWGHDETVIELTGNTDPHIFTVADLLNAKEWGKNRDEIIAFVYEARADFWTTKELK